MNWVEKLFLLSLKLYPRPFRAKFAEEMGEVFCAGLEAARKQGSEAGFLLREALRLPGSLTGVYVWSLRAGESGQMALTSAGGGVATGGSTAGEGWGASLLVGLPHLLLGIITVSSALLGGVKGIDQVLLANLQFAVFTLLILGVLIYSLRKGWQRWSASWLSYMVIIPLILLGVALNALLSIDGGSWENAAVAIFFPLVIAYLLYKTACADRLRGLLAAVPLTVVVWVFFEEFVPAVPKSLALGWLWVVAFAAAVMMLRSRRFAAALGLALAVPVLAGFPFAYLGVYMGGTLPFSEPGPSLREVVRQYLPILAMTGAIVLGPQLAVKLRAVGRQCAGAGGKTFYRLALGGILLGLAAVLLRWDILMSGPSSWSSIVAAISQVGTIAAVALYLVGFALLERALLRGEPLSDDYRPGLRLAALFVLLPGVPVVLYQAITSLTSGQTPAGWLLTAAEIAWVLAAAWMVKD